MAIFLIGDLLSMMIPLGFQIFDPFQVKRRSAFSGDDDFEAGSDSVLFRDDDEKLRGDDFCARVSARISSSRTSEEERQSGAS